MKSRIFFIPTDDIVQMAEFVLKNNVFQFNGKVKGQKLGVAIGIILTPPLMLPVSWS